MARPEKIPRTLYGAIREHDILGLSPSQISEWLAEHYRIHVAAETVGKVLRRIRVVPPVDGDGLTDLIAVRASLRADLQSRDWRQKHSAARLLIEIHQIIVADQTRVDDAVAQQTPTKTYTVDASPDTWPDPPAETQETQPAPAGCAQ